MSVGMNANLIYASIRDRNQKQADLWANGARSGYVNDQSAGNVRSGAMSGKSSGSTGSSTRALESQQRMQDKNNSIINQSFSYADSLKASRAKAKETSLQKKKLQYSYKKVSSQIVRSKDSVSARKAAAAARREVQRLKRLSASGEYDEEELQISIEHAKSMEKIAKKKVAHLQQEEMIERGHKGATAGLEEKEKTEDEGAKEELEENPEDELSAEDEAALEELDPDVYYPEEYASGLQQVIEDVQEEMQYEMAQAQKEMQYEMLEDLGLDELENTLVAPDPDMSEDDLKMLKLKHRTKEMKDIAKADGDYLKAIMDKYEKKGVAGMGLGSGGSGIGAPGVGSAGIPGAGAVGNISPTPVTVTLHGGYGGSAESMSFSAFA